MSLSSVHSLIVVYSSLSIIPFPIVVLYSTSWEILQNLGKPSMTQGIHYVGCLDDPEVETV